MTILEGPGGSGKSTLAKAILNNNQTYQPGFYNHFPKNEAHVFANPSAAIGWYISMLSATHDHTILDRFVLSDYVYSRMDYNRIGVDFPAAAEFYDVIHPRRRITTIILLPPYEVCAKNRDERDRAGIKKDTMSETWREIEYDQWLGVAETFGQRDDVAVLRDVNQASLIAYGLGGGHGNYRADHRFMECQHAS